MRAKLIDIAVPIEELLPKNSDVELLLEVLRRMRLKVVETNKYLIFHNHRMNGLYDKASGEIKSWGLEKLDISELKRAYSKELANHQAGHTGGQVAGPATQQAMIRRK